MESHNEITDAIPYFGNEEGVEAIIIKNPTQLHVAAKPIIQESKTTQVNETNSIPFKDEKAKNKFSITKPVLILLIVLGVLGYLVVQNSSNHNRIKLEQEAQAKGTEDSLDAANAAIEDVSMMEAVPEAEASDSLAKIENFEFPVPPNYTYLKDKETDWRDGEMIVPQGMLWSIEMMYNYGGEPDAGKTVASNLCHREVGKKTVDGVVGGGLFQGQHQSTTVDDYVYITINNKDFYWDDLKANYVGGKAFDMLKKFQIRRFTLPSGTNICFPSRDNGGPPGYFTFFVSEFSTNEQARTPIFQGTRVFCDVANEWYYIVKVDGDYILLHSYSGIYNKDGDHSNPKESVAGKIADGYRILTKSEDGNDQEIFTYSGEHLYVMGYEESVSDYKLCE